MHVTRASTLELLGLDDGAPRWVGCAVCSCSWQWSSQPRADEEVALRVAELAATAHRTVKAISGE